MVRGAVHRISATAAIIAAATLAVGFLPFSAAAAPTRVPFPAAKVDGAPLTAKPTAMRIVGHNIADGLVVRANERPDLFREMLGQVSWLATAVPQTSAPKKGRNGPRYTVVVLVKDAPQHTYDLYPLATGGPRAFRPAKQPAGRKVVAGWFYGRLTMSETLRLTGVPLPVRPDVVSGGIGGGERIDVPEASEPDKDLEDFFAEMRQLILLNGAVILVIALGLAGMSYLIRQKV